MTMKLENFGSSYRQKDGSLRSISSPAIAKDRMRATQTLLRATSENRLDVVRQCALQKNSELDGYRAYNQHGMNARKIVDSSYHFLPEECRKLHAQLRELPHLFASAEKARDMSPVGRDPDRGTGPRPGVRGEVVVRKVPGTRRTDVAVHSTSRPFNATAGGVPDFEGTGRITARGVRYAEEPRKFAVGDRVQVRDSEALAWRSGTVVSLCPTKVKRDGQTTGHTYRMIEFEGLSLPTVCGHAAGHANAPVVAEIPHGDTAEICGEAVGDFMKIRWTGKEMWVDRRDLAQKGFASQSQLRATVSLGELSRSTNGDKGVRDMQAIPGGGSSSSSNTGTMRMEEPPLSPKTHRGRELAYQSAMTRFTDIVSHPDKARDAVFKNPGLLRTAPDLMQHTMPAMATALRSEEFALRAVTKNPRLLNVDREKFRNVIPVLNVLLGSEEEAAYAIATRPELLDVARGQQFKETVQMVADCVSSMNDAVWLVVQTIVPPSIMLTARPHSAEALVGEYTRCKGVRVHDRPVYKKSAATLTAQFGAKAMDLYFVFTPAVDKESEPYWRVTPDFDPSKWKRTSKKGTQSHTAVARATSKRNSPDQVPLGLWELRLGSTNLEMSSEWVPDSYTKVADAGRPRTQPLLLCPPTQVRASYDWLQEALGIFWRRASPDGRPLRTARLVGCLRRGDRIHGGGNWVVQTTGDFTLKNNYTCLRLPLTAASSTTLSLQAWEPLLVYMLYLAEPVKEASDADAPEDEAAAAVEAEALAEKVKRDQLLESEGWWRLSLDAIKPPLLSHPPPEPGSEEPVDAEGSKQKPVPEFTDIFVRSYPRGACQVPVPRGPNGPPLVFSRPLLSGTSGRDGRPCEVAKAQPGEAIFFPPRVSSESGDGDAAAAAAAPDATTDAEPDMPGPVLKGAGDLGYAGYTFMREAFPEPTWGTDEVQLRIDTADCTKVVLAFFPVPPEELIKEPLSEEEAALANEAAEADPPAETTMPPKPQLPAWVQGEGWRRYEPRIQPSIMTKRGDIITADRCRIRDFHNEIITVRGPGPEMTCVTFTLKTGQQRKSVLNDLLFDHPGILGTDTHLEKLMRRLRVELGDELARHTLMQRADEWAHICQVSPNDLEAWIQKRKIESFERVLLEPDLWTRPPPASETEDNAAEQGKPPCRTLSITIVSAEGLTNLGFAEKGSWCCCRVQEKDFPCALGRMGFETRPTQGDMEWDETQEVTSWREGESLLFYVYDKSRNVLSRTASAESAKHDGKVAKVLVPCEKFYPDGFDGELRLTDMKLPGPRHTSAIHSAGPSLHVRIHPVHKARDLIKKKPEIATVSTPWFAERCRALKQGLNGNSAALQVLKKQPDLLLASETGLFAHALSVLEGVFGRTRAQRIALQHPHLLLLGQEMEAVFGRLSSLYPQVFIERMRNAVQGEWVLWRKMVSEREEVITKWLGRITAEERHLTCGDRVRNFGKMGNAAATLGRSD